MSRAIYAGLKEPRLFWIRLRLINSQEEDQTRVKKRKKALWTRQMADSFPASDPPSTTPDA